MSEEYKEPDDREVAQQIAVIAAAQGQVVSESTIKEISDYLSAVYADCKELAWMYEELK